MNSLSTTRSSGVLATERRMWRIGLACPHARPWPVGISGCSDASCPCLPTHWGRRPVSTSGRPRSRQWCVTTDACSYHTPSRRLCGTRCRTAGRGASVVQLGARCSSDDQIGVRVLGGRWCRRPPSGLIVFCPYRRLGRYRPGPEISCVRSRRRWPRKAAELRSGQEGRLGCSIACRRS